RWPRTPHTATPHTDDPRRSRRPGSADRSDARLGASRRATQPTPRRRGPGRRPNCTRGSVDASTRTAAYAGIPAGPPTLAAPTPLVLLRPRSDRPMSRRFEPFPYYTWARSGLRRVGLARLPQFPELFALRVDETLQELEQTGPGGRPETRRVQG